MVVVGDDNPTIESSETVSAEICVTKSIEEIVEMRVMGVGYSGYWDLWSLHLRGHEILDFFFFILGKLFKCFSLAKRTLQRVYRIIYFYFNFTEKTPKILNLIFHHYKT